MENIFDRMPEFLVNKLKVILKDYLRNFKRKRLGMVNDFNTFVFLLKDFPNKFVQQVCVVYETMKPYKAESFNFESLYLKCNE